jgi:hypothetical protein
MALCGVPDRVIRAYGRWKSYAYRIYIDLTEKEKTSWANVIQRPLDRKVGVIQEQRRRFYEGTDGRLSAGSNSVVVGIQASHLSVGVSNEFSLLTHLTFIPTTRQNNAASNC